jgi:hypothetical protein
MPPPNDIVRDCVAPSADTLGDPGNGELDAWQPQAYEVEAVTLALKTSEPRSECPAGECRFKGKVAPFACELPNSFEHDATGGNRDGIRGKRG